MSAYWQELMRLLNTKAKMSSSFHPQTDGQTEKANDIVERYLRAYGTHHQDTWDDLLAIVEYSYNSITHKATRKTLFELDLGYQPRLLTDIAVQAVKGSQSLEAVDFTTKMTCLLAEAQETLREAQDEQTAEANKKRRNHTFKVGDSVYVDTKKLSLTYANSSTKSRKLQHRWSRPFKIARQLRSRNAFALDIPKHWKIDNTFHVSRLRPDTFETRSTVIPPPPL